MCLAQGHNAVTRVRLEPAPRSRVKYSTTEPLRSLYAGKYACNIYIYMYEFKCAVRQAIYVCANGTLGRVRVFVGRNHFNACMQGTKRNAYAQAGLFSSGEFK